MQKRNILGLFVGLIIGLYTVLGMSLFIFINLKFNSVYYAQHIPHKEGTEPDIIMLMENMGWAYTPEIEGISYEYHVYEKMSAGIGTSVYDNRNYDTVYFNEELAHDFASWVSGDSMEPKYQNGSVALIRETGFDYDGAVYAVVWNFQTFIKKVYREKEGLRLVSINKAYKDIYIPYDENPRIVGKIVGDFMPLEL